MVGGNAEHDLVSRGKCNWLKGAYLQFFDNSCVLVLGLG